MTEDYSDLFKKVRDHMGWDDKKTELWFATENPNLGGISPKKLIFMGRKNRLEKWIDANIGENKK